MKQALKASRMRSQALLSRVSAVQAQRMAYGEMSTVTYVIASISIYALIVFLAMVLEDISSVFDFVSAYAISSIAFFIPSIFYRNAVQKFNVDQNDPEVKKKLRISTMFFFLGILNALLGISSAIITITGLADSGH